MKYKLEYQLKLDLNMINIIIIKLNYFSSFSADNNLIKLKASPAIV